MTLRNRDSAYRALMDGITVTPELADRVLDALERAERRPPARRWRPAAVCGAALCLLLALAWPMEHLLPPQTTPPLVQDPYAPTEYGSPQALAEALPYPLRVPSALPEGYELILAQALPGGLAELRWSDGTDTLCYRMAPGEGDISGDYNTYESEWTQAVGTLTIACRGSGGRAAAAAWTSDGFSYALTSEAGLTPEELSALVESIAPL